MGSAFAMHAKWKGKLEGRRVILIDDLLMTGATSDGCVTLLKRNSAHSMQIFCRARALCGTAKPQVSKSFGA